MTSQSFTCDECGAEFDIIHNESDNLINICPFCGNDIGVYDDVDIYEEHEDYD